MALKRGRIIAWEALTEIPNLHESSHSNGLDLMNHDNKRSDEMAIAIEIQIFVYLCLHQAREVYLGAQIKVWQLN